MWDHRWGRLRANLDVAKKKHARVPGGPVKLVCAVLLDEVYELIFSLWIKDTNGGSSGAKRDETYLDFGMVWGNAISNEPVWCP